MVADHSGPHRSTTRALSDVDLLELDPPGSLQTGIRVMVPRKGRSPFIRRVRTGHQV
jgi:hypothetical protein